MRTFTEVRGAQFLERRPRFDDDHLTTFLNAIQFAVNTQRRPEVIPTQALRRHIFSGLEFDAGEDALVAPLEQIIAVDDRGRNVRNELLSRPFDGCISLLIPGERIDSDLQNTITPALTARGNDQSSAVGRGGDGPLRKLFRSQVECPGVKVDARDAHWATGADQLRRLMAQKMLIAAAPKATLSEMEAQIGELKRLLAQLEKDIQDQLKRGQ